MAKNIRHQLRNEIMAHSREGIDKHSMPDHGRGSALVPSYGLKFQLLDRVNDFCKYLPADIKTISQITNADLDRYLIAKAETCTQTTLDEYRSELRKLGAICGRNWSPSKVTSMKVTPRTQRGAEDVISKEDFDKLIEYCSSHLGTASNATIVLEKYLGVRVGDICYGIEDKGNRLDIMSKNGKLFKVPMTVELRDFLSKPEVQKLFKDGSFAPCKDASVNRQLNRVQDRLGMERHSFHSIRRRMAQDRYDSYREQGVSKAEALRLVSLSLNHGEKRDSMLATSYLSNIW